MSLYDLAGSDPRTPQQLADGSGGGVDPLAMMLAQHMAMSGANNGQQSVRSPTQGASNMANSLVSWALMHPEAVKGLQTGVGNLLGGNTWDGMAASWGRLPGLSAQAAGNIAGGAAI